MHETYGDRVDFIGVAGRDDRDAIMSFIETLDVGAFQHAIDEDGEVWENYDIPSQPAFVFINDNGEVTRHVGSLGEERLVEFLEGLAS